MGALSSTMLRKSPIILAGSARRALDFRSTQRLAAVGSEIETSKAIARGPSFLDALICDE
jgi:hypothetical protein